MKQIIFAILMLFSVNIFADGITAEQLKGFDRLSEQQKADIARQVADAASKNGSNGVASTLTDPDKLEKWVNFGTSIGKGIGGVAKEIGVATNEFVNTPIGKLAVGLIVWKIMGNQLVHIIGAGAFAVIWLTVWLYLFRRLCIYKSITYTAVAGTWRRTKAITFHDVDNGDVGAYRAWFMVLFVICTAVTIFMAFSY